MNRWINKKIFIIFFSSLLLIGLIMNLAMGFIFFPNTISVRVGEESKFDFNIPAKATIYPEDIPVLNVNSELVEDNIEISLSEPMSLHAQNTGSANMELKILGIPIKSVKLAVLPDTKVVACGKTVGIRIDTDGILVLGTGEVNGIDGNVYNPCKGILKSGDLILTVESEKVTTKEDLIESVEECKNEYIKLNVKRGENTFDAEVKVVKSEGDNKNKIGIWVRDSTQGIGTVTYYDDTNGNFGALGHPITDVDTKEIMSVKSGSIMKSKILSVRKGEKGSPGELVGDVNKSKSIGSIRDNNEYGIYGTLNIDEMKNEAGEKISIGLKNEVVTGKAIIKANVDGNSIEEYEVNIESINKYNIDDSKGMIIRITDPKLLSKTNGIVQGMSGCPVIQNGKLIGAVTHVFVQEPSKGYGIFIENMLQK